MCRLLGGTLATVLSEIENNFLATEVKKLQRKFTIYMLIYKKKIMLINVYLFYTCGSCKTSYSRIDRFL